MTENNTTAGGNPAAAGASSSGRGSHPDFNTDGSGFQQLGDDDDVLEEIEKLVDDSRVEPPPAASGILSAEDAAFLLSAGQHDDGNAASVERLFPGQFLHSAAFGWLAYTGSHWLIEGAEETLDRAVVHTLARRIEAASQPETFEAGAALRKFALPNRGRLEGAKALLLSRVVAAPGDFDRDPDLLNCSSGVIELQTGSLLPHDPAQRFLHCAPVAYRPAADTSVWVRWLTGAVGDELADWLQLAVGYTLTGHTREEILFYLFGPPRAGKGLFTETLRAVLGSPLGTEIDFGTFTGKRTGDSQNFDLAPLKPCRYIAASESNSYERFNEAKLKALTGGNEVFCAYKHRDHFNYKPRFKIWLSSNQPINADPDDGAVWGRLRVVHFPHSYLGAEDKLLKQRMRAPGVLEGVLAWAVQGAMRWYALGGAGLPEPASSLAIKAEQRGALDMVAAWLDECCTQAEHHFTPSGDLYRSYSQWCRDNGVQAKQPKGLGIALMHKGYREGRATVQGKQARGFYGIRIG